MPIVLVNLPIPPSINRSYKLVRFWSRHKRKFVNSIGGTDDLANFKENIADYFAVQREDLAPVIEDLKNWLKDNQFLEFKAAYYMPREKLFFKNGKPRKLDASNRLKALEDGIAKGLGIDDSLFMRSSIAKLLGPIERIDVEITPYPFYD